MYLRHRIKQLERAVGSHGHDDPRAQTYPNTPEELFRMERMGTEEREDFLLARTSRPNIRFYDWLDELQCQSERCRNGPNLTDQELDP